MAWHSIKLSCDDEEFGRIRDHAEREGVSMSDTLLRGWRLLEASTPASCTNTPYCELTGATGPSELHSVECKLYEVSRE